MPVQLRLYRETIDQLLYRNLDLAEFLGPSSMVYQQRICGLFGNSGRLQQGRHLVMRKVISRHQRNKGLSHGFHCRSSIWHGSVLAKVICIFRHISQISEQMIAYTKISQLDDTSIEIQQHVCRLNIAVHQLIVMEIFQALRHLLDDTCNYTFFETKFMTSGQQIMTRT